MRQSLAFCKTHFNWFPKKRYKGQSDAVPKLAKWVELDHSIKLAMTCSSVHLSSLQRLPRSQSSPATSLHDPSNPTHWRMSIFHELAWAWSSPCAKMAVLARVEGSIASVRNLSMSALLMLALAGWGLSHVVSVVKSIESVKSSRHRSRPMSTGGQHL